MGIQFVDALIFYSSDIEKCVQFYRAIGLPLESEEHEEGPVHYACQLGGAHIAFYQATKDSTNSQAIEKGCAGAIQIGLRVDSVDQCLDLALSAGAKVIVPPEMAPWGRRAVFADTDGRTVELNQ